MATCNPDALLAANPCLATLQPFELQVVRVQMLCNLVDKLENGGDVTCDIQTLLTQGACFYAMPPFILSVIETQLLCELSQLIM